MLTRDYEVTFGVTSMKELYRDMFIFMWTVDTSPLSYFFQGLDVCL